MPQLHLSRRTGRRLLATSAIAAVAVLGTPAVASAQENPLSDVPIVGDLVPDTGGEQGSDTAVPAFPDPSSLPAGAPDFAGTAQAFATCLSDAGADITVALTGLGTGLQDALLELLGGGIPGVELPGGVDLPINPASGTAEGEFTVSQDDLQQMAADGQTQLPMVVTVLVNGVRQVVQVVVDLAQCLAALIPTPEAAPSTPPTTAPAYTPPATQPAAPVTTQPAPVQAVAYPGYAPTGGAPSDDSSPAGLIGLGALVAATGGGALWLRARRGVAG